MAKSAESIRCVLFAGHGTSGKTSLVEALLHKGGAIARLGSIDSGNTVCDFDDQEKEVKHSIDLGCARVEAGGVTIQMLDAPGYRDFFGQFYCGIVAVDCVVVVVSADDGVQSTTRKVWEICEKLHVPRVVVINRVDREHGDFDEVLGQIREQLSNACVPCTRPNASGSEFASVASLLGSSVDGADALMEAVVETDDALMERYLEGQEPSAAELDSAFRGAIATATFFPVFATSATKDIGIAELLDAIAKYAPAADTNPCGRTAHPINLPEETVEIPFGADSPLIARVFRVVSDPYVGKLTHLRIFSGSLATNGTFINPHTGKSEKIGKLVTCQGKDQIPIEAATPGMIVALVKVESLKTFDVVTDTNPLAMANPPVPVPMASYAVSPKTKADEKKFAESFMKLVEEDVMLVAVRDRRTHELIVSGTSQLHLQVIWERLKSRYGVEIETREPKIPYLETISRKGEGQHRHKKQSGGAGEFGEVWLRVEPTERGSGVEFENAVFGGAISGSYVQSAEKGIRVVMDDGIIAGCQVVDVKVTIYDGKEHPVDSKDIAFQKAGREAFRQAFEAAKPILLEPIVHLEVTFPSEYTGDIQGDLSRRRGKVQGVDAIGNFQILKVLVPLAEIADYASSLGSMTAGQGSYIIEPAHYEAVPSQVQKAVVDAHNKERAAS